MSDVTHALRTESAAAKVLLANVADVIGDDEDMALTVVEGETTLIEAIAAAVERMAELDMLTEAIGERTASLNVRKSRLEGQHDRIKAAVMVAMQQAELRKLELPTATLSLRAVAPKCEIIDESAIPSKFFKAVDPRLDRKAVIDALKAKEVVPGARLSNGGETLSILGA